MPLGAIKAAIPSAGRVPVGIGIAQERVRNPLPEDV
jgi:hypothetical protein